MNEKTRKEFRISTQPNLSSKTLFHFTNSVVKLNSIIMNGLRAYYNYEKLPKGKKYYVAPMLCFCDIPLSNVKFHVSKYGTYGIGIRRQSAREAGFTPVFYVHSDSKHITFRKEVLDKNPITPFIKPYLGYVPIYDIDGNILREKSETTGKQKLIREKRKYYDEKEWRLIPKSNKEFEVLDYKNEEELIKLKEDTLKEKYEKVDFDLMLNLEYIILQERKEITPFIENLRRHKMRIKEEMIAKIITVEQIQNDF